MNDKEFLKWIYDRIHLHYDENPNVDYMHKLRNIIDSTDPKQITLNMVGGKKMSINIGLGRKYNHVETKKVYTLFHADIEGDGFIELSDRSIQEILESNFRMTWSGTIEEFNEQWEEV